MSAHREETLHVETEDERITLHLKKRRRRFAPGEEPSTRYRFCVVTRTAVPEDAENGDGDDIDFGGGRHGTRSTKLS